MDTGDSQETIVNADLPRRMPWSVRAASIIADSYCAIAAIAVIASAIYKKDLKTLGILVPLLVMFAACFDLHRGHRWTLRFFRAIGAACALPFVVLVCAIGSEGIGGEKIAWLYAIFCILPLIVVPFLLYLPPSRQWWRPEGRLKWLSRIFWLFILIGLILGSMSASA